MKEEGLVISGLCGAQRRAQQALKSGLEKPLNAREFSLVWWLRARFGGNGQICIPVLISSGASRYLTSLASFP